MGSLNYVWRHVVVCIIMVGVWLTGGCANNETRAPISSVGCGYSDSTATIESTLHIGRSRFVTAVNRGDQRRVNDLSQENIIYNRNYDDIKKGSYSSEMYQVKQGDTLFYIAWITGNDYQSLAQKNNISEPYSLSVGQTLRVSNTITPITNTSAETTLVSNANQANTDIVTALIPTVNRKLTELSIHSNKNNSYSKNLSTQNTRKRSPSLDGKILPTTGTTVITNTLVATPNTVPTTTAASSSTAITNWHWPTNGRIIDNFSVAEGGNRGIDISGFRGQPILATANGKVVYAGNALQGYGNLIIIKHNNDYLSAYAHNDMILVREQQEVRAGQKIATMGSTGTSTTRLHFEIRYKGKSVNPLHYFSQK